MDNLLLWCVLLFSSSALLDASLPKLRRCKELVRAAEEIKKYVNESDPEFLYAPVGVKPECLDSALACFRSQISQLKEANGQNKLAFHMLIRQLKSKSTYLAVDGNCMACSAYATERPKGFLGKMVSLLQQIVQTLK